MPADESLNPQAINPVAFQPPPEVLGREHVLMQWTGPMPPGDKKIHIPMENRSDGIGEDALAHRNATKNLIQH